MADVRGWQDGWQDLTVASSAILSDGDVCRCTVAVLVPKLNFFHQVCRDRGGLLPRLDPRAAAP